MERLASIADFEVVCSIYMDEANNPFMTFEIMSREDFRPIFQQMLAAADVYVYEIDNEIVAVYRITRKHYRTSHIAYFGSFAMHPTHRGRGYGKQVMLHVIDKLRREGIKRLELLVVCDNERAIGFYRRLGFEIEGTLKCFLKRANSDDYLDELMMAKILG
jgi:putative acetyltransferase